MRNEKVLKFRAEILKRSQKYHTQVRSDFREAGWLVRESRQGGEGSLGHLGVFRHLGKSHAKREEGKRGEGDRGQEEGSGGPFWGGSARANRLRVA